jgi:hypothetical protein
MAEDTLVQLTTTTVVNYKAKDGSIKELRVIQPLDPTKRRMDIDDIRLLAKEISKVLKEDAL